MSKPWVGYLGSFFILLAGVLLLFDNRPVIGSILILASFAGIALKYYLNRK